MYNICSFMQSFFMFNRAVVSLILKMSFSFHVAINKTILGIKILYTNQVEMLCLEALSVWFFTN